MDRLAIEFISTLGMPPVDFVPLAAKLGVSKISLAPSPITENPYGYTPWDLRTDPALLQATKAALKEHSVTVSQGEGFLVMPGIEINDARSTLDVMVELDAPQLNCVVVEQDRARALDQFARFAEMAAEHGKTAMLEFMPMMWPANINEALDFITESRADNARIMLDSMHFFRSGSAVSDLANIDLTRIGYVQICDVPMPPLTDDYGEEARHERRCPGDGDLPLADFLRALPRDLNVGVEVPRISKAKAGVPPAENVAECVKSARDLLTEIG